MIIMKVFLKFLVIFLNFREGLLYIYVKIERVKILRMIEYRIFIFDIL